MTQTSQKSWTIANTLDDALALPDGVTAFISGGYRLEPFDDSYIEEAVEHLMRLQWGGTVHSRAELVVIAREFGAFSGYAKFCLRSTFHQVRLVILRSMTNVELVVYFHALPDLTALMLYDLAFRRHPLYQTLQQEGSPVVMPQHLSTLLASLQPVTDYPTPFPLRESEIEEDGVRFRLEIQELHFED